MIVGGLGGGAGPGHKTGEGLPAIRAWVAGSLLFLLSEG